MWRWADGYGGTCRHLGGREGDLRRVSRDQRASRDHTHMEFQGHHLTQLIPLHASLSADDQGLRALSAGPPSRKVVIASNIAETSLTIDGVVFLCSTATSCTTTLRMSEEGRG
ncbi:hypothetical protein BDZ89DRAFT_1165476 [Hymenopellis radicata]|nr:hypothetical protein BDZ89DRAFT_1165476 [Hymenopellis radicata]